MQLFRKCPFPDLNWGPLDYETKENRGSGIREERFNKFNLFSVYKTNKNNFIEWIGSKYSQGYFNEINSTLEKIFNNNNEDIEEIKKFIYETKLVALRSSTISLRVFFNFCEFYELLDIEQLNFFRNKIKIHINKGIDSYVPEKEKIIKTFNFFKENYPKYEILYKLLLESGCRITELKHLISSFNKKNIETWDDDLILYRNFYLRGQKSSYYLFFTKRTYDLFIKEQYNQRNVEHMKDIIKYQDLTPLKYLRKYNFTLMIENNISFEVANFIQGRTSQNIGFNHYLAKKTYAVKEYSKILNKFDF